MDVATIDKNRPRAAAAPSRQQPSRRGLGAPSTSVDHRLCAGPSEHVRSHDTSRRPPALAPPCLLHTTDPADEAHSTAPVRRTALPRPPRPPHQPCRACLIAVPLIAPLISWHSRPRRTASWPRSAAPALPRLPLLAPPAPSADRLCCDSLLSFARLPARARCAMSYELPALPACLPSCQLPSFLPSFLPSCCGCCWLLLAGCGWLLAAAGWLRLAAAIA